jgi:hypothetical protein
MTTPCAKARVREAGREIGGRERVCEEAAALGARVTAGEGLEGKNSQKCPRR